MRNKNLCLKRDEQRSKPLNNFENDKVVVIIDYIQFIDCNGNNDKQNVDIITRELKALANNYNIPIVAISSLSREGAKRNNISSFKESGSIEYTADYLIIMYQKENNRGLAFTDDTDTITLEFLKNRFGENLLEPIWFDFFGLQGGMCGTQCTQQLAIHNMLTYLSNDVLKSLKEIQVGYVMNDDAVSFQEELKDVVSTGFKIQDKVNVPITYPLIQKHKYYIDDFIQQHLGFNHLCLSCQFPSFNYYKDSDALYIITTTCNDCTSCMHSQLYNLNFYRGNCVVLATRIPFAKRSCF